MGVRLDGSRSVGVSRLEVIEGPSGRRRRTKAERARIAAESMMPGVAVADVARKHGTTRWQIYDWRKQICKGKVSFHIAPIVDRMAVLLKRSGKLFADETTMPVLDPGAGKTKKGFIWAMLRDDRPWGGSDPPGVVFTYAPGRAGIHAEEMLKGFEGVLQVDGYQGYNRLADGRRAEGGRVQLAFCWAHARRKLIEARPSAGSPFVDEALRRIAEFYAIEKEIRGQGPEARRAVRQERSKPFLEAMHPWLVQQAARLSKKSDLGMAAAYVLDHWPGLVLFADDGRIEMDSNLVENRIRPLTMGESLYPSSSSVWKH